MIVVKMNEDTGWGKKEATDKTKTVAIDFSQKKKLKKVYLPAGTEWYDFWTNKKHKGDSEIDQETTMDEIPLYVKAGSIIPWGQKFSMRMKRTGTS